MYQLSPVELEFAVSSFEKPELLSKDLSTDFVRMDQFIKKLQDEKLTGYIEMSAKKNRRVGKLSLKSGATPGSQT